MSTMKTDTEGGDTTPPKKSPRLGELKTQQPALNEEGPNLPVGDKTAYQPSPLLTRAFSKEQVEAALNKSMIVGKPPVAQEAVVEPTLPDVKVDKAAIKPKEPLITNVKRVPKAVRAQFAERLSSLQKTMMNFLLLEIVPYEAALLNALEDASESVRLITGAQHASIELGQAHHLITSVIPEMKALRQFAKISELSEEDTEAVVQLYLQQQFPKFKTDKGINSVRISPNEEKIKDTLDKLDSAIRLLRRDIRGSVGSRRSVDTDPEQRGRRRRQR